MSQTSTDTKQRTTLRTWGVIFFATFTAIVGHKIHGSLFWAFLDFIFWPVAWIKWFCFQEVSLSLIKSAFAFFLQ